MFDHVTIRVADRPAAERFYDLVLPILGTSRDLRGEYAEWGDFSLVAAGDEPPTLNLHVGFSAADPVEVERFWRTGVGHGYRDDGSPGPRPQYGGDYVGGFLLDPDGNSIEAVRHDKAAPRGHIDHLWIRVADVARSREFYEAVAPFTGFSPVHQEPGLARFRRGAASFTVLEDGPATQNVHVAFPGDRHAVDGFHGAATAAGHPDAGAPAERPRYHPGYYAAFVLDPDGHRIEVVDHGR